MYFSPYSFLCLCRSHIFYVYEILIVGVINSEVITDAIVEDEIDPEKTEFRERVLVDNHQESETATKKGPKHIT